VTGRGRVLVVALVIFALAVGVLIGSGPLRAGLGAGMSQAERLERARAAAEAAEGDAAQGRDFADAVGPAALAGTLEGHVVALVRTPAASDDDLTAAGSRIADADASVGATVAITELWTAEDRAPFRDALAEQITAALPNPPVGATTSQILSAALAQALAAGDEFDAEAQERSDTLWTLLTGAELVTGDRDADASLVLLIAADGDVADLANAFVAASDGTVVGFTGGAAGDAGSATTVTRAATFYGGWAVAGAMVGAAGGTRGAYDASDADELVGSVGR
jgi:hypothetical protein